MFEVIFLILTAAYFLVLVFISSGLMKNFKKEKSYSPKVSVIVAARNEEENILECLYSLYNQSYDHSNFEVIIVDDSSTDNTAGIVKSFICDKPSFKLIDADTNEGFTGKTNALLSGISKSRGEILMFTDADCRVPPQWISGIAGYYTDPGVGMVNGFSTVDTGTLLKGMQGTDLLFLVSVAAGMANNGYPASCIGNNMSVRKCVYVETGGYDKIKSSLTEDYMLVDQVSKLQKYSVIFPVDENIVVETKELKSLKEIVEQKKRWASGGMAVPNISIGLMGLSYAANLLFILSFFMMTPQVFSILLFKIFSEFLFLYNVSRHLSLPGILKYFILFDIYYVVYTLLLPVVMLFNHKVLWKGRTY